MVLIPQSFLTIKSKTFRCVQSAFRVWQNYSNGVRSVRENCGECASKVWVKCRESAGKVGANWAKSNDNVMMELFKIE